MRHTDTISSVVGVAVAIVLVLSCVVGCQGSGRPAPTVAIVEATALAVGEQVGPAPEDITILNVAVSDETATVHARGTVVDAGALPEVPAVYARHVYSKLFRETSVETVTIEWGYSSEAYVSITYSRAAWERAAPSLLLVGRHVMTLRLFRGATEYAWLDEAEWRQATSKDEGAFTANELPVKLGQ